MGTNQQQQPKAQGEIGAIFTKEEITFDFYSCEEAIIRLNEYLDHELTPQERADVLKHLHICQPCLHRFSFEETLLTQIRMRVIATVAPASLRQRLGAALRSVVQQSDAQ